MGAKEEAPIMAPAALSAILVGLLCLTGVRAVKDGEFAVTGFIFE